MLIRLKKVVSLFLVITVIIAYSIIPATADANISSDITPVNASLIITFNGEKTVVNSQAWCSNSITKVNDKTYKKVVHLTSYIENHSGATLESLLRYAAELDFGELETKYSDYIISFETLTGKVTNSSFTVGNLLKNRYYYSGSDSKDKSLAATILGTNDDISFNLYTGQESINETNGYLWINGIVGIVVEKPGINKKSEEADYSMADVSWYKSGISEYSIKSAQEFLGFAKLVNEGNSFKGKTIILENNINMCKMPWTPIGSVSKPFIGILDGCGYSIINFSSNRNENYNGLFGFNLGTIKNLTVSGKVTSNGQSDYVGGIVGFNAGIISSVISKVTVNAPSSYNVGGIAGFNTSGTYVDSDGGVKNINGATGIIEDCGNRSKVTGYNQVGGITGENAGIITKSMNEADIIGENVSSKNGVAGIAGRNGNNNEAVEEGIISYCYNKGTIGKEGQKWTGGITGFNNAKSSVFNSYNIGSIVSTKDFSNSIAGCQEGKIIDVHDNYSLEGINNTSPDKLESETGIIKAIEEMKSDEFLLLLNGNTQSFVKDEYDVNNGYPVFSWETKEDNYDDEQIIDLSEGWIIKLVKTKYSWTGNSIKPVVKVSGCVEGTDYSIIYDKNSKNVGKHKVIVKGTGCYKGTVTLSYTVLPKKTSVTKLKAEKKAITVNWTKQTKKMSSKHIDGYEIKIATNSSFTKGVKTVKVKGYKICSKKLTKLKKNKRYYVKVRTYIGELKSDWSRVRNIKTK